LFNQLYIDNHHRQPRNPREIVHAYLSVVNELNRLFESASSSVPDILLDYRLHLILSNLGGSLTRCLCCGRYHDGVRAHCISCNGLLFKVSNAHPDLCLARCNGTFLSPHTSSNVGDTKKSFIVLVQSGTEQTPTTDDQHLYFALQPDLDVDDDDEYYLLYPPEEQQHIVKIILPSENDQLQDVELENPRLYWQNVQRVVDALLIKPETKMEEKLLGFIDNREKASGIRFRLRDEIAERALTNWAAEQWSGSDTLPLLTAYSRLEKQALQFIQHNQNTDALLCEMLQEMPFWFARMLTRLDEYDMWQMNLAEDAVKGLQADELALITQVFLSRNAIDRTAFPVSDTSHLKHFFLEKYRVETEFGIGLESTKEVGYDIISLGERGVIYQHVIDRIGAARIKGLLDSLHIHGLLVRKQTHNGIVFYQLNPHYLTLACHTRPTDTPTNKFSLVRIECHTADHSSKERAEFEKQFSEGKIHALICTPTLEMGVDIGDLKCVAMIGFPPSPANYAQRAGRAGRGKKSHSATIVILSSPGSEHDTYYAADPRKMIDGTITPPQFTLTNMKLLAAHFYAHILAGKQLDLLNTIDRLEYRIDQCIASDELDWRAELHDEYQLFAEYLHNDVRLLPDKIKDHELGYRQGYFPDYGFRRDGVPLLNPSRNELNNEDSEAGVLTSREPEEAVRKLAPGRIVYCGGRPVRVDWNQEHDAFKIEYDPQGKPFRAYKHLLAEKHDQLYIYTRRDPDTKYVLKRNLHINNPFSKLQATGPGYCRIYFVPKGTLYVINEGVKETVEEDGSVLTTPLQDSGGEYRIGASLQRDGLLLSLSEQILPPDTRANFLAVLLRSIPDYFNLDDGELRVISEVKLCSPTVETRDDNKYLFLYGHDESGLVPFDRIFGELSAMLTRHLQVLESCICSDDGCYHCLFSMNSQHLIGTLSRQQATAFLRAYLQVSLLQPHIAHKTQATAEPDLLLKVELKGRCVVTAENLSAHSTRVHYSDGDGQDQNTAIYTTIYKALVTEASSGARTVKILTNLSHIDAQLQGKAKVNSGQKAFLRVKLAMRSWQN
jgi:Helicase conserved C-terminal domain/Domain of unknown function (DUF1998)